MKSARKPLVARTVSIARVCSLSLCARTASRAAVARVRVNKFCRQKYLPSPVARAPSPASPRADHPPHIPVGAFGAPRARGLPSRAPRARAQSEAIVRVLPRASHVPLRPRSLWASTLLSPGLPIHSLWDSRAAIHTPGVHRRAAAKGSPPFPDPHPAPARAPASEMPLCAIPHRSLVTNAPWERRALAPWLGMFAAEPDVSSEKKSAVAPYSPLKYLGIVL